MPVAVERLNGGQPAATLWGMLPGREDLATKSDLTEHHPAQELKDEISDLSTDSSN